MSNEQERFMPLEKNDETASQALHKNPRIPKRDAEETQVEGFMQNNLHIMPPESVASVISMPITSFEDT